jgi:LPXTG-site transpeptidase (sortase) family protein
MIRAWPAIVGRAQLSTQLLGEVALVALLLVTAASSWRDGTPSDELANLPAPVASTDVSGGGLSGTSHLRPNLPVVAPPASPLPQGPVSPPVQILIPLLDVHRAVEKIGVDQFGTLQLPVNAWNAGWFKWGPVPGARGDAVIEGHAGSPGHPLLFGKLARLKPGDQIIVVHADGTRRLFLVVSMTTVPADSFPSGLAEPAGPPRLTLVTCTGHFDKKNFWYSDRLLLEARYAGLA